MGGVPAKRNSKSKVRRRRSQLALKKKRILSCPKCKGPTMPHRICPQCGFHETAGNKKSNKHHVKKEPEKETKKES